MFCLLLGPLNHRKTRFFRTHKMLPKLHARFPLQSPNLISFPSSPLLQINGSSPPFSSASWSCVLNSKHSACIVVAQARSVKRPETIDLEPNLDGVDDDDEFADEDEELDGPRKRFRGRAADAEKEKDYDRDPVFAEILGNCLDEPEKAQSRMEERLRKKKHKILHTKTGSANPMKVTFRKFEFSNSYIWFEFYNSLLEKDVTLICDAIRSWHIVGRLGGCNSLNMQLSQAPFDKRPSYDAIQGANVEPTTFYNIGDFEIQDNIARIWVDIGNSEPLLLDVLINALIQISSDYVGIKQVVFGGSEFENWNESLKSEDAGYSLHKI